MEGLGELLNPAIIEEALVILLFASLGSGATFLYRQVFIRIMGGRRRKTVKVLNKSRVDGSYKKRTIAKRLGYLALCLPGILSENRILFSVPLLAGIALSIVDTLREKDTETAIEYERGVLYRGHFARWRNITFLSETEEYEELRIAGEELYYYKKPLNRGAYDEANF